MKEIKAPWSDELVKQLNEYQEHGGGHPYTCRACRDKYHTRFIVKDGKLIPEPPDFKSWENDNWKQVVIKDRNLVATRHGWICHTCDDIQDWCWDFNPMKTKI